ncbi:MAG: magnesium transporter, partial [Actinobacteria bacterium]|nr:magnesium transporter [Actinomycetota bacterium]
MSVVFRLWPRRRPSRERARPASTIRFVTGHLISAAGLVGSVVRNQAGGEIGRIKDIVVRWDDAAYPQVTGLVIRVGRRITFLHATNIAEMTHSGVQLRSARLDLRDFVRRDGEIQLIDDLLDHQLIDVSGVRVVRSSDLYLASIVGTYRLVGVDVGLQSLMRRLGPARVRRKPTPSRVIDWSTIQPISRPGEPLRLGRTRQALHRLRPAELADLVEELGAAQRQAFVAALDPDVAAEMLEEMETEPLEDLLTDMPREQAANLLANMAPDEASEALREMDEEDREEVLDEMGHLVRNELALLLAYDEDTAGSMMTNVMVVVSLNTTVEQAIAKLGDFVEDRGDIDGVLIVDESGRLIDDISLFELLLADRSATVGSLTGAPYPVTVHDKEHVDEVLERFVDS